MTAQTTTPANDPWGVAGSRIPRLPNLFNDLDDNTITVTTQQTSTTPTSHGGYVQIKFGTAELRLDPIEAERLGNYVAQAADKLHGEVLEKAFAETRNTD